MKNIYKIIKGAIIGDFAGSIYCFATYEYGKPEIFPKGSHLTKSTAYMLTSIQMLAEDVKVQQAFGSWKKQNPEMPLKEKDLNNGWIISSIIPHALMADSVKHAQTAVRIHANTLNAGYYDIIGAEAAATAIHMVRSGYDKTEIKRKIEETYSWNLDEDINEIRARYNEYSLSEDSCINICKHAIMCFLKGKNFKECLRYAIMTGGDTTSIAALTGTLAAMIYDVPITMRYKVNRYLPKKYRKMIKDLSKNDINKK